MDSTHFTEDEVDLEAFRARLRKMTDEELIWEGKAGRYLCSLMANFGKPPRKVFVVTFGRKQNRPQSVRSKIMRSVQP